MVRGKSIPITTPDLAIVRLHGRRSELWGAREATVAEKYRYLYDRAELGRHGRDKCHQALVLGAKVLALSEGRYNVSVDDLRVLTAPALRHRVILNFEGEAEAVDVDTLIGEIVEKAQAVVTQSKEAFLR